MKSLLTACAILLCAFSVRADDAPLASDAKDEELQRELLRRKAEDRDARTPFVNWVKQHGWDSFANEDNLNQQERAERDRVFAAMQNADAENTRWLKCVVAENGWPTRSLVGQVGASAAWLLVQHADADPAFQRKCLDLMAKLPKEEVSQVDFARLTDRVLVAEGKKQIYGTLFYVVDGKLQSRPLEDANNVEKLRADVGLPPLADELKGLEKTYGNSAK